MQISARSAPGLLPLPPDEFGEEVIRLREVRKARGIAIGRTGFCKVAVIALARLLVSGAILRLGMGAESLAWMSIFILAPVSAVYYPVAALPAWLQPVAYALPSAHAFEGMRSIIVHHSFDPKFLIYAAGLNALYMVGAMGFFLYMVKLAREGGALLQTGE